VSRRLLSQLERDAKQREYTAARLRLLHERIDQGIQDAYTLNVPVTDIAAAAGLSRQGVYKALARSRAMQPEE